MDSEPLPSVFERVFTHALDLLCVAGFDGYFKVLNPAWTKALGWTTAELLARPWLDFVHPDDHQATRNATLHLRDGKLLYQFENRYFCKDGTVRWLSWDSFPYPDDQVIIAVARDITQRKQLEAKMAEQLRELQRWHDVTLGRETRVLELKREVNELLAQAGLPPKYQSVHDGFKPEP